MNKTDEINLSEQTKFRLNQIRKIKNCFHQEINQIKLFGKRLSKYVLIVLSVTTGGVTIISFTSVAGAPVGKCKFYSNFFSNNRNNENITKNNKERKIKSIIKF